MSEEIKYMLFAIGGFLIHLFRKYDAYKTKGGKLSLIKYLDSEAWNIYGSFLCTSLVFFGGLLDGQLSWSTSLFLGYAGDNFFRYIISRYSPDYGKESNK